MRIYNRYVLSLVLTACVLNILLAFLGRNGLEDYFIVNTFSYLVITLLYVYLNRSVGKSLNIVSIVFFAGFMAIIVLKITQFLSGG